MTITDRHRQLWAKADELTKPATDPADGKFNPRAYHRRPAEKAARVTAEIEVEPDAPEMVQAVR